MHMQRYQHKAPDACFILYKFLTIQKQLLFSLQGKVQTTIAIIFWWKNEYLHTYISRFEGNCVLLCEYGNQSSGTIRTWNRGSGNDVDVSCFQENSYNKIFISSRL